MRFQLITQLILIILSVVIIVTVVKPKFTEIQGHQVEITRYKTAVRTATAANEKLQSLVQRTRENFSDDDRKTLNDYLPEQVDTIKVAQDIQTIVESNNLLLQDISVASDGDNQSHGVSQIGQIEDNAESVHTGSLLDDGLRALDKKTFSVEIVGSYENMKSMLQDVERNAYPLRLTKLAFIAEDASELLTYTFELETYALSTTAESLEDNNLAL